MTAAHRSRGCAPPKSMAAAAREAGISRDQMRTALRVASIPDEDFERLVESDEPPTVTKLAKIGKEYRRLRRERPDLAPFANAAVIEASIEAKTFSRRTPLAALVRAWNRATAEERRAFLEHVAAAVSQ